MPGDASDFLSSYLTLLRPAFLRSEFLEYFKHFPNIFLDFAEGDFHPLFYQVFATVSTPESKRTNPLALQILLMVRKTTYLHLVLFKKRTPLSRRKIEKDRIGNQR